MAIKGYLTEEMAKELIAEVLLQAVADWKALDYGNYAETLFISQVIRRHELITFFNSPEFEAMARYVGIPVDATRSALKIPIREVRECP